MYLGRIVEIGDARTVLADPQHPYTRALRSVVPVPDPSARRRPVILVGETPDPSRIPSGCRFHPRCPVAFARCPTVDPPLFDLGGGHAGRLPAGRGRRGGQAADARSQRRAAATGIAPNEQSDDHASRPPGPPRPVPAVAASHRRVGCEACGERRRGDGPRQPGQGGAECLRHRWRGDAGLTLAGHQHARRSRSPIQRTVPPRSWRSRRAIRPAGWRRSARRRAPARRRRGWCLAIARRHGTRRRDEPEPEQRDHRGGQHAERPRPRSAGAVQSSGSSGGTTLAEPDADGNEFIVGVGVSSGLRLSRRRHAGTAWSICSSPPRWARSPVAGPGSARRARAPSSPPGRGARIGFG